MPNGPWTAYSGGFQNGMTLAITPKNVVLRDNSLKPLLQCINYVILKIFKIETFWSTLMAKFMLLGVIGMCSINFMQKKIFWGGHAFWLTQNSWNAPFFQTFFRHWATDIYNCCKLLVTIYLLLSASDLLCFLTQHSQFFLTWPDLL